MANAGQMSLALLVSATNSHAATWLHPEGDNSPATNLGFFQQAAQMAERGFFDLFFIADTPAARTDNLHAWSRSPSI